MIKIHTALFVILMLVAAMKMDNIQEQQGTLSHELSQAPVKHQLSYIDQDHDQVIPAFSEEKRQPKVKMLSTSTEEKSSKPKQKKKVKSESTNKASGKQYSNEEMDLLSRLVHAEAKGESYEGKKAVASVVLNRVEHRSFPDSVKGVIYQRNAFQPVSNGSIHDKADQDSIKAVKQVVKEHDRTTKAIYFYNPKTATDHWIRSRKIVERIGRHVFAV
ncbi:MULTISPECIES: cell wall hydrolase [Bacillus]|uniref:cell wall hydrolase n=1 Tax=Bacillus TaxID=1386 RepID=UPI0005CA8D08|nr:MULTISPECIES: cell wall hydrolase [Bacillus]TFV11703.1 cell wall hydrolase [Bacillus stratosphericus]AYJ89850.1 cell wall hydrolase [Bacillus safensis]KIZ55530.1 peptigoglycan-binding protein LysM [Bacillus safensis]MCM3025820.1 cell wall hydrolase [Bacillus safensis]MCP9285083.1 cell wall hydrolase [Bacillus safensis]